MYILNINYLLLSKEKYRPEIPSKALQISENSPSKSDSFKKK